MKKTAFLTIPLLVTAVTAYATGPIKVTLEDEGGAKSANTCGISNDYNFKESCTDASGVAQVDVGDADRVVQLYVKGTAAACARSGESVTITVKTCGTAISWLCPVTENKCR
jgi:hypothetical protein